MSSIAAGVSVVSSKEPKDSEETLLDILKYHRSCIWIFWMQQTKFGCIIEVYIDGCSLAPCSRLEI